MPTLHSKRGKVVLQTNIITREATVRVCQLIVAESGETQRTWATRINVAEQTLSRALNHADPAMDYVRDRILLIGLQERLEKTTIYTVVGEGIGEDAP